jgi:hypothetical protein
MKPFPLRILLVLALVTVPFSSLRAAPPVAPGANPLPEYHAQDSKAAVVTEKNLIASERFWPYHVAMTRAWQPPGASQPLPVGIPGVLIRVEASGKARIDFGRDGRHEVPVGDTDLIERANLVREGKQDKLAPNFILAVGTRLLDSSAEVLGPLQFPDAGATRGFLCVFADPGAESFAALAGSLAPLRERAGVLTILFPQGNHADAQVREELRSLGWPVPFMYGYLSEAYTRSLLAEKTPLPSLLLQTPEGRVLFQGPGKADVVPKLTAALDRALGGPPTASAQGAARARAR